MSRPSVVVLDYGSGNLHSASQALAHVGADVTVTSDEQAATNADALVVPGVGAFAACMAALSAAHAPRIIDRRLAGGRPVLGICVGMQVMFEEGTEHGVTTPGLGEWPGAIEALEPREGDVIPHMGWNHVHAPEESEIFAGLHDARFYFVHSYAAHRLQYPPSSLAHPVVSTCDYAGGFVAAVENGPLVATQFHPEKSGDAGLSLLHNWLHSIRSYR